MKKIDHIGIAVRNLDETIPYYTEVLQFPLLKIEEVASEHVRVAFIDAGNVKIELLQPLTEESAIHKFIEKRGEGIHHVAIGVNSIEERMEQLRNDGVHLLNEQPKIGAGGAQVAFMHPKSSYGVLYELCQKDEQKE